MAANTEITEITVETRCAADRADDRIELAL